MRNYTTFAILGLIACALGYQFLQASKSASLKGQAMLRYQPANLETTVVIADSVTSIGDNVFAKCSTLTSITLPDGLTEIDGRAFSGCKTLVSVTLPDSLTTIVVTKGSYAHEYARKYDIDCRIADG